MALYTQALFSSQVVLPISFLFISILLQLYELEGKGFVLPNAFSVPIPTPGILIYIDDMNEKSYSFYCFIWNVLVAMNYKWLT